MGSIRNRLRIKTALVVAVFCAFFAALKWTHSRLDETLTRVNAGQVVPEGRLRDIDERFERIHRGMLEVLLSERDPSFEVFQLEDDLASILASWRAFVAGHAAIGSGVREGLLIELVGDELPALTDTVARIAGAYRNDDRQQLGRLARQDWPRHESTLAYHLAELTVLQQQRARQSYDALQAEFGRMAALASGLLAASIGLVLLLSAYLNRHINRQIETIESSLELIAAGHGVALPAGAAGTEFGRIAAAINATLQRLQRDREQIEALGRKTEAILACMVDGIYGVDGEGRIIFVNRAALAMLGYREGELIGRSAHETLHHHRSDGGAYPVEECRFKDARIRQATLSGTDEYLIRKDGTGFPVEYVCAPLRGTAYEGAAILAFRDITERQAKERELGQAYQALKRRNEELQATQSRLLQSEKMASIGQLAAGVAHEINNPVGFVTSNMGTLRVYVARLMTLLDAYEEVEGRLPALPEADRQRLDKVRAEADLAFLREDIADLLMESQDGLERIRRIVADLKDFSHVDEAEWQQADINAGIESTLNVVWNELKYRADVVRELGELPPVRCLAAQLNQLFMNLLINAAQAMESRGTITVRTRHAGPDVMIEISDTGKGMEAAVQARIFEPFFTTKPVGKGTGLGLSIAWDIVSKHDGELQVSSAPERGTTFSIRLPVRGPAETPEGAT